jgi:TonB family protein
MALWAGALVLVAVAGIYLVRSRSAKSVQPPQAAETLQAEPAADAGPAKSAAHEPTPTTSTAPAVAPASTPSPAPAVATPTAPPAEAHPAPALTVSPQPQSPASSGTATRGSATPGTATKGEVAERALPDVSSAATGTIQGKVDLSVEVSVAADGSVENASFRSAGPSKYFSAKAIEAARKWKFTPPQADGHSVPSKWLLHFQFRASGIDVVPQQESP